jgi:Xaa-Pro aminopeptidase
MTAVIESTALQRIEAVMASRDVAAIVIGPGADLVALTGYRAHASERPTVLVARADGEHALVVPALEAPTARAGAVGVPVQAYAEGADPYAVIGTALGDLAGGASVGIGDQLWAATLLGLQQQVGSGGSAPHWFAASRITREVRMVKDAAGLDGLRRAGQAIDQVHRWMGELLRPGLTEAVVGQRIAAAMADTGHARAAFTIVGSGPNGASPHHETSDRVIEVGDAVVVDIGGPVDGWFSDCTRNYVVGHAPDGYDEAFAVLHAAQRAAVAHVRPGVTAASVDAAAREVIDAAGYGDAFIHRTGHGIGLEVHEEPYIIDGNDLVLQPGMTFSVEPGIYLEGRFGMRIEDIVAVTDDGHERLNTTDTSLVTLPA